VRVLSRKQLRAKKSLKNLVIDVNGSNLFRLRQFCTTFCRAALLVDGVRAVEEFLGEKNIFCFKVTGLSYVHWSLRDKSVVLILAYFLLTGEIISNFKFRVSRGLPREANLVNIIYF
jgi:hypothetical protein